MSRTATRNLAAGAVALACTAALGISAAGAASTDGGANEAAAPIELTTLGSMKWGWYQSVTAQYPSETAQVAAAMDQAINNYNTVATYSTYVPVTYNPGVPTAEANYSGSVQFGGTRSATAAQHELSHFMGMQGWVNGGKATWSDLCNSGWANTKALGRMQRYYGTTNVGVGCSASLGHFWDYGLNYGNEWNWLSKGRNVGMVGAMRSDLGLSDGSNFTTANYRLVNRSTGQVAADATSVENGDVIGAPSTVSTKQAWTMSFANGFVQLKNLATGRYLTGSGATASVNSAGTPGDAQTWEMTPTTEGYFQLRNVATNTCVSAPTADTALAVGTCDTNADAPATAAQWHLAKAPEPVVAAAGTSGTLIGTQSGKCIDVPSGVAAQVQLYSCNDGTAQRFTYTAAKELRLPDGTCLDANRVGRTNGTAVITWTCHGGNNQKWNFNANGSVTGVDSGLCLDGAGFGTANGTKVQLWSCTPWSNQRWTVK
jgi:Ricin-type beta-trefoil lectin domain/Cytolethal distending toxin A/C domain